MRGEDHQQSHGFSYLPPEQHVRLDHPLRAIREMVDVVLGHLSRRFDAMYAKVGRPSIAQEKLLRAQLLQMLYSIRSERLLMEEMDYNLLFRWFVGLNADDPVWDATTFTKKTATACWKPISPKDFWRWWWRRRGGEERLRMSASPSTVRCWKPGRATRAIKIAIPPRSAQGQLQTGLPLSSRKTMVSVPFAISRARMSSASPCFTLEPVSVI